MFLKEYFFWKGYTEVINLRKATLNQLYQIIRFESCGIRLKRAAIKELERREQHVRCDRMGSY